MLQVTDLRNQFHVFRSCLLVSSGAVVFSSVAAKNFVFDKALKIHRLMTGLNATEDIADFNLNFCFGKMPPVT